ncbi:Uncharacterised protein [Vibrio cholerae]|nr:Uncharacterised protein [Vibrio cholerae]CSB47566.1 Uncharacterised protein [Vibrio cholerae]CSB52577.1 Uncharacterised protein [Vibrio cholerae]CSB58134.1 Uncharacterised protein [Vibrio cholerae]CSB79608.1 Uncharacterised protein [Vibrio cholerae]
MQEIGVSIDFLGITYPPQRGSTPFTRRCQGLWTTITQAFAHIMQQQIGVRLNSLLGKRRTLSQLLRQHIGFMARLATRLSKQFFTQLHLRILHVTTHRHR